VAEVASELAECLEVLAEELSFELALDPGAGVPAVLVAGSIDRIDRLPSGGIEVVDYTTGRRACRLSEVGAHLVTHPGPAPPSPFASRR